MGDLRYYCIEINTGIITNQHCGYSSCPIGFECAIGLDNPNYGITSFDNIGSSLLVVI